MLRIKLSRRGKKKQAYFRLLVLDRAKDPFGTYLENVGQYNPRTNPSTLKLEEERIKYWLSVGAQPTDSVHNLLVEAGIIEGKKRTASKISGRRKEDLKKKEDAEKEKSQKSKPVEEAPKEEAKPADEVKEEKKVEEVKAEPKTEEKPAE